MVFSGDLATGLYSIGSYGSGNLSFYRGVGLSMNGKTTFVFAADTAAVDGIGAGIDAPLLFEQFRSGSTVGYRIGIVQATTGGTAADRISFGTASSTADWTEWGYVHSNGFMTSRSVYGASGVFFGPNANTGSATATASTVSLNFNGTPFLTYNNSNSTLSTSALIQSDTGFSFGPSGIGRIAASSTTYTLTYNGTAFMTYTGSTTRVSFGNAAVLTTGQMTAGVFAHQRTRQARGGMAIQHGSQHIQRIRFAVVDLAQPWCLPGQRHIAQLRRTFDGQPALAVLTGFGQHRARWQAV